MELNFGSHPSRHRSTNTSSDSALSSSTLELDIPEPRGNVFFNSNITISELKRFGNSQNINDLFDRWDKAQQKYRAWSSSNASPSKLTPTVPLQPISKYPFPLTSPPGFEQFTPKSSLSNLSTESETSPKSFSRKFIECSNNEVILDPAPMKIGFVKREKRGIFNEEEVSPERQTGVVKFYQLKKRFGFITLDEDGKMICLSRW